MKPDKKKDQEKIREADHPASGKDFKSGKPDSSPLPNNPAKNAEKTSPEEDKKINKNR